MLESTGGRPSIEYLLNRDSALAIIMMSGGPLAKELRKKVIELYKAHDTGLAFTTPQIEALMDLSKAVTLISIQKEVEKKHFNIYNNPATWYEYRAGLLGYSKDSLIEAMCQVNKKYHSMRSALVQLDSNELIRTGVIDIMKALGKTDEYSRNVGDLCKSLSEKANFGNIIWDDTKENPLGLNQTEVIERKKIYDKSVKALKS